MDVPSLPFEMKQVQLGNHEFEGQNNCYVLGTEPGATLTLVDTGIGHPEAREQLEAGLADHGIAFADVEQVLLSHWHQDHVGLAGEIQAASGCSVHAHAEDAPLIARNADAHESMNDRLRRLVREWGTPDEKRDQLLAFLTSESGGGQPPDVTTFADGDRFDLGSVDLEVVHLPGHSAGLSGFAFDGRDGEELFPGDALLPYYTPNVGGADTRVEGALGKYLDTLAGVVERGYTRAWPGHRGAIIDPPGRAADIVEHHRHRTGRIVDVLDSNGPADPWTVSDHLFGELQGIHILHGPGEAHAHLAHLADAGVVERDGDDYALVDRDADLDALFPDVSGALAPERLP